MDNTPVKMRVITRFVMDNRTGNIEHEDYYFYEGEVAKAGNFVSHAFKAVAKVVASVAKYVVPIVASVYLGPIAGGAIAGIVSGGGIKGALMGAALGGLAQGASSGVFGQTVQNATNAVGNTINSGINSVTGGINSALGTSIPQLGELGGAAGGTGINLANAPSGGPGINLANAPLGGAGITGNAFGNGVGQLGGVLGGAAATGISASAIPTPGLDASTASTGGATGTTTGGVAGTAPNLTSAVQGANIGATGGAPSVTGSSGLGAPAPTAVSGGNLPIDSATTGGGFNYTSGQATDTTTGGAGTVSGGATGGDVVSGTGTGAGGTGVNLGTASDTGGGGGFNYNPTQATTGATTSPYSLATQGSTQGALGATTIGGETPASSTVGDFLGKAGSSILDTASKNIFPLGMLAYQAANKPAIPPQLDSVTQNAALAGTTGTNLIDTSTKGIVTSGQQSNINMWTMQAKAQVKDYYARQGLSGSSMEASALANVDMQASNQVQAIIQQNLTQGLTALGASNTGNTAVANAVLTSNNQVSDLMARLAAATGSSAGQATNKTGTA